MARPCASTVGVCGDKGMWACRGSGRWTRGGVQGPGSLCPGRQSKPGDFTTCLVLGRMEEGGESPRLLFWPGVMVDLAWGTLNILESQVGGEVGTRLAHILGVWVPSGWAELQASMPHKWKSGIRKVEQGIHALLRERTVDCSEKASRGYVEGGTAEQVCCR